MRAMQLPVQDNKGSLGFCMNPAAKHAFQIPRKLEFPVDRDDDSAATPVLLCEEDSCIFAHPLAVRGRGTYTAPLNARVVVAVAASQNSAFVSAGSEKAAESALQNSAFVSAGSEKAAAAASQIAGTEESSAPQKVAGTEESAASQNSAAAAAPQNAGAAVHLPISEFRKSFAEAIMVQGAEGGKQQAKGKKRKNEFFLTNPCTAICVLWDMFENKIQNHTFGEKTVVIRDFDYNKRVHMLQKFLDLHTKHGCPDTEHKYAEAHRMASEVLRVGMTEGLSKMDEFLQANEKYKKAWASYNRFFKKAGLCGYSSSGVLQYGIALPELELSFADMYQHTRESVTWPPGKLMNEPPAISANKRARTT